MNQVRVAAEVEITFVGGSASVRAAEPQVEKPEQVPHHFSLSNSWMKPTLSSRGGLGLI